MKLLLPLQYRAAFVFHLQLKDNKVLFKILTLFLAFTAAFYQSPFAQTTQVYNITGVVNMPNNCGTAGPYNCTAGTQIGFDWIDIIPVNNNITSVTIEFREGVECSPGARPWYLNGVNQGNVTTVGNACACTVGSAPSITLSGNSINYIKSGSNSFRLTVGSSCLGLYPNWGGGTVYGIVTVQYSNACPTAITGTTTISVGATTTLSTTLTSGGGVTYLGTAPIMATRVFTANSTFTTVQSLNAQVLVVGGGGGGSSRHGGGGGGGGVQYNANLAIPANTYTVTVGSGGAGGWYGAGLVYNGAQGAGDKGGNSAFGGLITALGGGGGRTYDGGDGTGASGGGGTGTGNNAAFRTGGAATQGFVGGNGSATTQSGGGGGGAGAVGASVAAGAAPGGTGGVGISNSITGSAVFYGGGGGGGGSVGVLGGIGGNGGGGHGGDNGIQTNQTAGAPNTGGGGGGCRSNNNEAASPGGSGIVVIRYPAGVWSSSNPSIASVNSVTGIVTGISGGAAVISYTSVSGCAVSQLITVTPAIVCPGTSIVLSAPLPSGGTITNSGTDRIHTFTSSGTFTAPQAITTGRVLVVAGGGGGGSNGGGGGGAGGLLHNTSYSISAGNTSVTVGGGGAAAPSSVVTGISGNSSSFGSYSAAGGGGGASRDGGGGGLTGGSGGGGGGGQTAAGGSTAGQGNVGRVGYDNGCYSSGGGGGGAGGIGTVGALSVAGNGGVGISNDITGAAIFYAGGGGGGTTGYTGCVGGMTEAGLIKGTGGNGGGGAGESSGGTANTGGGGGAERPGGSGIVVVRYAGGTWATSNPAVATIGSVDYINGTATINTVGGGAANIIYTNPNGVAYPIPITVNSVSTAPTGATGITTICSGGSTTLTVSGGTAGTGAATQWFSGSCGGTLVGTGNSIVVAPTSTTLYYVRYSGTCGSPTNCGTVSVTVNQPSIAPVNITGVSTICTGTSTTLTSSGGGLGTDAIDVWYIGSCSENFDQGWNTQPYSSASTTLNSLSNGIINVTSTTNDPMIFMDAIGSFDPVINRYVNIRYRVTGGVAGGVEIFFYNTNHNFAVGGETGYGTLNSDGNWHVLSVDMHADPDYLTGGNIVGWRYDWATNSGVTMDLDFISIGSGQMIESGPSVSVSPTSTTTYFTSKKGTCNNTSCAAQAVTVRPTPTASISGNTTVCQNAGSPNVTFTNPMSLPVTVTYNINGASNSTINIGANTTANLAAATNSAGSFAYNLVSVVYQITPSCSNLISGSATVIVRPTPMASVSGTTTICQNGANPNVTFTNPMSLPVTVTYNINNGVNTTLGIGANTNSIVAVSTVSPGTFTYNLVSVEYQSGPTCINTLSSSASITVNPIPAAFTVNQITTTPLCFRGTAQIQIPSSIGGISYQLRDNTSNVGSAQVGNGSTLTFSTSNLTSTTSSYNVIATTVASCTNSVASPVITVDALPANYANNGDLRTCYVNTTDYVEFSSANGIMMSINSNGQNLGNVTVTEYAGAPVNIQACDTYQPWYVTSALGRHWVVQPQFQPASPVSVRLYFDDSDYLALQTAADANSNPNDNITALASLDLSKYSNTGNPSVVNGSFADNCGPGTYSTVHAVTAAGTITGLNNLGSFVGTGRYAEYSFTGFSELWMSGTNNVSPLPIELTSFTASCELGNVKLEWTTATEINNEKFIIDRSADLQTWEEVHIVPGAGNSNESLNYSTIDNRSLNGLSYYRLTQKDYDGKSEMFEAVSVTCYSVDNENKMIVYPNPTENNFALSLTLEDAVHDGVIEITDITGKTITFRNVNLTKGNNEFMFDRGAMQAGQYIIKLLSNQIVIIPVKLIIR